MPPDVTTISYFSLIRRAASMISSSSSAMTSTLFRLIPSEKQNLAKYAEFVSTVYLLPVSRSIAAIDSVAYFAPSRRAPHRQ